MSLPRTFATLPVCLALATPAFATFASDVCPPAADPCIVPQGSTITVTDNSTLDFGTRALVLPSGSGTRLDIGSGTVTIIAGSLTLNPGSSIDGSLPCPNNPPFPSGAQLTIELAADLTVLRDGNRQARIDVSSCVEPGRIEVIAGGTIRVEGLLSAQGTQAGAGFGEIYLNTMGDVSVPGSVTAAGGADSGGGDILVVSGEGDINVSGSLDTSGGDGGSIALNAGDRIVTTVPEGSTTSRLDARAVAGGGSGGIIDLQSGGEITLGSPVHLQGEASAGFGGDGGELLITSGETLTLAGVLNVFGTVTDGLGGDVEIMSDLDIVHLGALDVSGKRSFGAGGFVAMIAHRDLTTGPINARGDCEECAGGDVDLAGWCSVTVPVTSTIDTTGSGGAIEIQSGGTTDVAGTLAAGGDVDVRYHPDGTAPNLGGSITPAPLVTADANVIACGGPGVCDHDNVTDEGEECDDGNFDPCDACTNSCHIRQCGNGRIDAPCEECDDGNQVGCDGCNADCTRADDVCGDGTTECSEQCDPGSAISCDADGTPNGCSALCAPEGCGNGVAECLEECDLGAQNGQPGSFCAADCTRLPPPNCGDDVHVPAEGEQCDDGDTSDCDGCNHLCEIEACGNGTQECLEECDDGNTEPCDGCNATCVVEACGNGTVDCGEECDDGEQNGQPGSTCLPEACVVGPVCSTEVTEGCIPCADALDCDPLGLCGGLACETGVCTPAPLDCDDANVCTADDCQALTGCTHALRSGPDVPECDDGEACTDAVCTDTGCEQEPKTGFPSIACRLADLEGRIGGTGIDLKARSTLGKLLSAAGGKVAAAEQAQAAGKRARLKRGLKGARKSMVRFGKKVFKLSPAHIFDPALSSDLSEKAADAIDRVDRLRDELGV